MYSTKLMLLTAVGSAFSFYNTLWLSASFANLYLAGSDVNALRIFTAFMASFSFMLLVIQLVIFCREFCKYLASDDR